MDLSGTKGQDKIGGTMGYGYRFECKSKKHPRIVHDEELGCPLCRQILLFKDMDKQCRQQWKDIQRLVLQIEELNWQLDLDDLQGEP